MAIYLDFDGFKSLTLLPIDFVTDLEARAPGWIEAQLESKARWIDARLRKRYATPFAAFDDDPPTPPTIQDWLARIVTLRVMLKRGVDPDDAQFVVISEDAKEAMLEIAEASDSDTGKFDLPSRADEDGSAISRGDPRSYSEASPYVWSNVQRDAAALEDDSGRGTSG
jgi:hypothetical protein